MDTIAIFGAAGKMGARICERLTGKSEYELLMVEHGDTGLARLRKSGYEPTVAEEAARRADVVFLAVPDLYLGEIAETIVPLLRTGALVCCLDPAAPYAGKLPERQDISYFATHPAHPPVFKDESRPNARKDYFGAGLARQAIVSALIQGPEEAYAKGEKLSSEIFGPILRSHRVTIEQMAMLEPMLSETVGLTAVSMLREGLDEVIKRGVPEDAAFDFLMGHIGIELAIFFGFIDIQISDGAKKAMKAASKLILRDDWKKVFTIEALQTSVGQIVGDIPVPDES